MLAAHHPSLHPSIRVRLAHTFLHTDDREQWDTTRELPVRQRIRHVMWPGVPESRFFFDSGDRDYEIDRHSKVIPRSFRAGPLVDGFVVFQYNERSPEQALDRALQRTGAGWQDGHYLRFLSDPPEIFTDSLDHAALPFAPEFEGDPEGPFRALTIDDVPYGPEPDWPPLEVSTESTGDEPGDSTEDVSYVVSPGALLDLVDRPSRLGAHRWGTRMRDLRPGHLGHSACGGPGGLPGYHALLRHTERTLGSRRTTLEQRRTIARELIQRLAHVRGRPPGSTPAVRPHDRHRLEAILDPGARVDTGRLPRPDLRR